MGFAIEDYLRGIDFTQGRESHRVTDAAATSHHHARAGATSAMTRESPEGMRQQLLFIGD
jgi:hypothetical protein